MMLEELDRVVKYPFTSTTKWNATRGDRIIEKEVIDAHYNSKIKLPVFAYSSILLTIQKSIGINEDVKIRTAEGLIIIERIGERHA